MKEYITHEPQDKDAWICICKNTPSSGGFYPCLENGEEVEPTINGEWGGELYVCSHCGRIINQDTREVVGIK